MRNELCEFSFRSSQGATRRSPSVAIVCSPASLLAIQLDRVAPWVIEAAKKLEALGKLQTGWDSYGGSALTPEAKEITAQAIDWMGQEELPTPAVVLGSGGTVQLEWRARGKELTLDLGQGGSIEFVQSDSQGNIKEGLVESSSPGSLNQLTTWFLHGTR